MGTVREEETSELAFYSVEASLKLKRRFTFISCDVGYKLINCVSWYQDEDQLRASLSRVHNFIYGIHCPFLLASPALHSA